MIRKVPGLAQHILKSLYKKYKTDLDLWGVRSADQVTFTSVVQSQISLPGPTSNLEHEAPACSHGNQHWLFTDNKLVSVATSTVYSQTQTSIYALVNVFGGV